MEVPESDLWPPSFLELEGEASCYLTAGTGGISGRDDVNTRSNDVDGGAVVREPSKGVVYVGSSNSDG
jgi:hypothetical protein